MRDAISELRLEFFGLEESVRRLARDHRAQADRILRLEETVAWLVAQGTPPPRSEA
jgi:hypothetical protein